MRDHRLIDERSLALSQAIARQLQADPGRLVALARSNLDRWTKSCSPRAIPTLQEWSTILNGSLAGVLQTLCGTDERSVRLRQSNPFAGALPQKVRNEIFLRFQARDEAAA
jgi:hypothetical protein